MYFHARGFQPLLRGFGNANCPNAPGNPSSAKKHGYSAIILIRVAFFIGDAAVIDIVIVAIICQECIVAPVTDTIFSIGQMLIFSRGAWNLIITTAVSGE